MNRLGYVCPQLVRLMRRRVVAVLSWPPTWPPTCRPGVVLASGLLIGGLKRPRAGRSPHEATSADLADAPNATARHGW